MEMCMGMERKKPEEGSVVSSETRAGVPEPDQKVSKKGGPDRKNADKPGDGKKGSSPRLAERMTGLRGLSIGKGRVARSTLRAQTEGDLRQTDAEIPYIKTEKALRDLICSLMERQDQMNETLFAKLNDLEYRVDDAEYRLEEAGKCPDSARIQRSGADKGG